MPETEAPIGRPTRRFAPIPENATRFEAALPPRLVWLIDEERDHWRMANWGEPLLARSEVVEAALWEYFAKRGVA